jgi:hypothetical protein
MQYRNRLYAEGSSKLGKPYTARKKEQISRNCFSVYPGTGVKPPRNVICFTPIFLEWTSDHERMLEESGSSFSPIDPAGLDQGIKNSRFGLKINLFYLTC